ncbi:MAG: replication initiator protein [Microviridae sp.]|nr:MAG: replication initiator protein [Microviridae sp.]
MPCYHPVQAWRKSDGVIIFKASRAGGSPLKLPCGQCIGCRLRRSREWAVRSVHEAQMHEENSFITLTYSDDFLPEHSTLVPRHFDLFMKKLRKAIEPRQVRYYMCGEYGENFGRPHYHAILFGLDFPDKEVHQRTSKGITWVSPFLAQLWGMGFCTVGAVTFESAAYCARYVIKKQLGKKAAAHYTKIDRDTGEVIHRVPEYARMSRRPGLGSDWIEKYVDDVYPSDCVILRGRPYEVPGFYDRRLAARAPQALEAIKAERVAYAESHEANNTRARLAVREKVQVSKLKLLKRELA